MRYFAILAVSLALGACSSAPQVTVQPPVVVTAAATQPAAPAPSDPLAQLRAFTLADLTAASADAKAQTPPDITASQCYDFLAKNLPTLPSFAPGQTVGAVMAFQKLRDLQNGATSQNGFLKSLNLACAPLVIDTQTVINKLALIGAGSAATAGAATPLLAPLLAAP